MSSITDQSYWKR